MEGFETKPVNEISGTAARAMNSAVLAAFAELPEKLAMFVPSDGHKLAIRRTQFSDAFRHRYVERVIHSKIDREKNGVWFWWEPKP